MRLLLLLLTFCIVTGLSSDDFDSLFQDIEINNWESAPLEISGISVTEQMIPYNDLDQLEDPSLINSLTFTYEGEDVEVVTSIELELKGDDFEVNPLESYIVASLNNTTIKAGYLEYNWGVADKLNPTDTLNPKDYSDPTDIKQIPSIGLNIEQFIEDFSFELSYIPVKNTPLFPESSRDSLKEFEVVGKKVDRNVIGGKFNYYGTFDLSISYLWGVDDFYTVRELNIDSITIENKRTHDIGLNYKTIIDGFGLWFEGVYSIKEPGDIISVVLGFDRSFGPQDEGLINIQGFGQHGVTYKEDTLEENLNNSLQNRKTQTRVGGVANISYKLFNSQLNPEISLIYINYIDEDEETFLKPEIGYTPLDSLVFKIGSYIDLNEPEDGNSITLGVEYSW